MPPTLDDVRGCRDLIPVRFIKVIDGDTVLVQRDGDTEPVRVRLAGIDTPELPHPESGRSGEPLGPGAADYLSSAMKVPADPGAYDQGYQLYWPGGAVDDHNRPVGFIFNGDRLVNWDMVRQGYSPYVTNPRLGGVPAPWEDDFTQAMAGAIKDTAGGKETIYSPSNMKLYLERHGIQSLAGNEGTRQVLQELPDGTMQMLKLPPAPPQFKVQPFPKATAVGDAEKYARGMIKIGTIWLPLPPEAISIQTDNEIITHRLLRSPGALAERSGFSQTLISITGKLDTSQLGEALLPVLAQFACCPFLPVRNVDLERHLFDKGILFTTGLAESETARQAVGKLQQKMDLVLKGARESVDPQRSEISPDQYGGLVGGFAEQICAMTEERRGNNIEDTIGEFQDSFEKKLGSVGLGLFHWVGDRKNTWSEITEDLVMKDDSYLVDNTSWMNQTGKDIMHRPMDGSADRKLERFKQSIFQLARLKWAQKNAARDWSFPLSDVRMTDVWVALASFGAMPLAGSQNAISFNMVLQVFNYLPYTVNLGFKNTEGGKAVRAESIEQSAPFNAVWPRLISGAAVDLSTSFSGLTFLRPPSDGWGNRPVCLSIVERSGKDSPAIPQIKARVQLAPEPERASFQYSGDFVQLPIEGERYPTLQWMGMGTSGAQLSFLTEDESLIEAIKDFDNAAGLMCRRYERRMRQFYFVVEDPFLNAMGLSSCEIATFSTSTAGPGMWRVELSLQGVVPKLYELHQTEAVRDAAHKRPVQDALDWCLEHQNSCDVARQIWRYLADTTANPSLGTALSSAMAGVPPESPVEQTLDAALATPGRQMLARIKGGSQDGYKSMPAAGGARELVSAWNGVMDELQNRTFAQTDTGFTTRATDQRFQAMREEDLRTLLQDLNEYLEPVATAIEQAQIAITSQPVELQQILGGVSGLLATGDFWKRNLYRDFPESTIADLQAKGLAQPQSYWNPDQWKAEVEQPSFLADPWFFLHTTSRFSEDGGPSELPMGQEITARNLVSRPSPGQPPTLAHRTDDTWDDPNRAKRAGGSYGEIAGQSHGNAVDKNAVAKIAKELGYWDIATTMDYQNVGVVNPSDAGFIRNKTLKALDAARWQWKGIAGAMPTFWMAFVEKDNPNLGLFDDFYDYQALESFSIVRQKWGAADVAYVSVSNLFGNLGSPSGGQNAGGGQERHGLAEGSEDENPGLERGYYPLAVGTQVIIKAGYGNNVNKLETVFTGQVAEVTEGPVMELVLQGYGAELLEPLAANTTQKFITQGTAREIAELMLAQPQVAHFGRRKLYTLLERLFLGPDPMEQVSPSEALMHTKVGQLTDNGARTSPLSAGDMMPARYWLDYNFQIRPEDEQREIHDVNIFLPNENDNGVVGCQTPARRYEPFIIAGQTPWGVLQDIAMDHPGIAVAVRPYDGRATLFMGNPELDYIQSSRALWGVNLANQGQKDSRAAAPRPFRRYHLARSGYNLVKNSLEITKEFYNEVTVGWQKPDGQWIGEDYDVHVTTSQPMQTDVNPFTGNISDTPWGQHDSTPSDNPARVCLDTGIEPGERRALMVQKRNATSRSRALRYAMSILGGDVGRVYKGSIWMRSDVDIWPWDVVMLFDEANQMYGPIEVDEVILHFDRELGYVYEVKPNALVTMQNYITRDMLHSNTVYMWPDGHIDTNPPVQYSQKELEGEGLFSSKRADNLDQMMKNGGNPGRRDTATWGSLLNDIFNPLQWIRNDLDFSPDDTALAEEAQGKNEVYAEDTYNAIANHPISVFPLMYQGRPWWPLAHRGSLIDTVTEKSATPDDGAAADSRKVNMKSPAAVYRVFRGAYSNAKENYKENR